MRIAPTFVVALFLAHVAVSGARAAPASSSSVELRRSGGGLFVAPERLGRFTLAGVRWQGPGRVELRTRSVTGRWSAWRDAAPEAEDAPDPLAAENRRAGWRLGNPWWVGESDGIQARVSGRVSRVAAVVVASDPVQIPYRSPAMTGTPTIVTRAAWGADESIRRAAPAYSSDVRFAIVHHTAGTNDYTRAQAPAIVRGIERYHVLSNGWNDIGYNFLVDRFGTVYEGRYGGVDRNVIGAHALGFNTGSVGIALIGSYGDTAPSKAALDALERLIAWRLDLAHVDPTSTLTVVSGGSERWANGVPVRLRAVSGHRDTGSTECPGDLLYARLGEVASQARAIGGPKIFEPKVQASGSAVRARARLSASLAWTVTITTKAGTEVARGTGTGTTVDWSWDDSGVPAGTYSWTIAAPGARPASGTLKAGGGTTAQPGIESASLAPDSISPNNDGQADTALLSYKLTAAAAVTVQVADSSGAVVATPVLDAPTAAGDHTTVVTGDALADGTYYVSLIARFGNGTTAQATFPLTVSRALGAVGVSPSLFSPNGDGRNDVLSVAYSLLAPASVVVRIERDGRQVVTPFSGDLQPGSQAFSWDGSGVGRLRDGPYEAVVEATTASATATFGVPFVVDTTAPRVRLVAARKIRLSVSEPALLTIRVDGHVVTKAARRAGIVVVPWPGQARRVRVVATDAAGNRSLPVVALRGKDGKLRQ